MTDCQAKQEHIEYGNVQFLQVVEGLVRLDGGGRGRPTTRLKYHTTFHKRYRYCENFTCVAPVEMREKCV
jgi:hypothetical protein